MSKVNLQLRDAVLQAACRRSEGQNQLSSLVTRDDPGFTDFDKGYKMRTEVRRMIDVGILGMVNDHEASKEGVASLKTLLKLANNIIVHPEEEKFRRFKINNPRIKKEIMDPKGVLEFAIKMGFRQEKVIELETYRIFMPKYHDDLVLCASLLEKAIDREHLRVDERLKLARENEEKEEHWTIAMKRFGDDRKRKEEADKRERDARQRSNVATAESGSNEEQETESTVNCLPIENITLSGNQDDEKSKRNNGEEVEQAVRAVPTAYIKAFGFESRRYMKGNIPFDCAQSTAKTPIVKRYDPMYELGGPILDESVVFDANMVEQ
ncbi:uncharacterized protein EV420DRAFT_1483320 [Desarmillaria tabescens]|uniref:PUB domain-containing protein n=1 Tax=Armillaria tabescens TaxID=1929756 RepID=A0AA39JW58_ARMTA|nr:uncharacterized protein EV420DRAFT_1483320 [Desarmillaria tabescens]KAK0448901.1 hypothetical protein EV420DRAFT_1483320 [Desarmillaria tabescens]